MSKLDKLLTWSTKLGSPKRQLSAREKHALDREIRWRSLNGIEGAILTLRRSVTRCESRKGRKCGKYTNYNRLAIAKRYIWKHNNRIKLLREELVQQQLLAIEPIAEPSKKLVQHPSLATKPIVGPSKEQVQHPLLGIEPIACPSKELVQDRLLANNLIAGPSKEPVHHRLFANEPIAGPSKEPLQRRLLAIEPIAGPSKRTSSPRCLSKSKCRRERKGRKPTRENITSSSNQCFQINIEEIFPSAKKEIPVLTKTDDLRDLSSADAPQISELELPEGSGGLQLVKEAEGPFELHFMQKWSEFESLESMENHDIVMNSFYEDQLFGGLNEPEISDTDSEGEAK